MEEYGKILTIAMPVFLVLIIIEKIYAKAIGEKSDPIMDTVSSISSGMTNAVKDVLGLSISFISYGFLVSKLACFHFQISWFTYIVAFFIVDFYGYWTHRWSHEINFFWNKHAIHHSSEEFNLACALRQSISSFVNLFIFLLIPAAILGIPATLINTIIPIHLFLQFWYHTKHIKKMGFLENIIVTPSHHRVHHAINSEYLDKNHGQIFIFWDKFFGTFQAEIASVQTIYGITRPANTWNPIKINFQHLGLLIHDTWRVDNWKDKFQIWFKPTGWRPNDFEKKYPVERIENIYEHHKFETNTSNKITYLFVFQAIITLLFISYLFQNVGQFSLIQLYLYGLFIFVSIYSYTDLMDKNTSAMVFESIKCFFGFGLILYFENWFGLSKIWSFVIPIYLFTSLITSFYVLKFFNKS